MHFYCFGPIFKKYGIKVNTHTYTHNVHCMGSKLYSGVFGTLIKDNTQFCTSQSENEVAEEKKKGGEPINIT